MTVGTAPAWGLGLLGAGAARLMYDQVKSALHVVEEFDMSMISQMISEERVRAERSRRAMPAIWSVVALFGLGAIVKTYRAMQVASAYDLTAQDGFGLLWMGNSTRIQRSFTGYEAVFIDYATSAFVGLAAFSLAVLMLTLRVQSLRRQVAIMTYIEELERRPNSPVLTE